MEKNGHNIEGMEVYFLLNLFSIKWPFDQQQDDALLNNVVYWAILFITSAMLKWELSPTSRKSACRSFKCLAKFVVLAPFASIGL